MIWRRLQEAFQAARPRAEFDIPHACEPSQKTGSSIHSFKLTVQKLIELIDANLKALENHLDGAVNQNLEITEVDIDDPELADFLVGGKTKVLLQDMTTFVGSKTSSMTVRY